MPYQILVVCSIFFFFFGWGWWIMMSDKWSSIQQVYMAGYPQCFFHCRRSFFDGCSEDHILQSRGLRYQPTQSMQFLMNHSNFYLHCSKDRILFHFRVSLVWSVIPPPFFLKLWLIFFFRMEWGDWCWICMISRMTSGSAIRFMGNVSTSQPL